MALPEVPQSLPRGSPRSRSCPCHPEALSAPPAQVQGLRGREPPAPPASTQPPRPCSVSAPPSLRRKSHSPAGAAGSQPATQPDIGVPLQSSSFPSSKGPWGRSPYHYRPHPCHLGLRSVQGTGMGKAGTGCTWQGKLTSGQGKMSLSPGPYLASPREPCLAGTCLHHPKGGGRCPPLPASRPSTPHTALAWDGSLAATVAVFPWGSQSPGAAQGSCLSHPLLHTSTAPLPPSLTALALPRPRRTGHAAATPATGEETVRSKQAQAMAPACIPSPPGLGGIKKVPKRVIPCSLQESQAESLARRPGFVQRAAKARACSRRWARGGFAPCPDAEGTAGTEGSTGRAELPGKVNYWWAPWRDGERRLIYSARPQPSSRRRSGEWCSTNAGHPAARLSPDGMSRAAGLILPAHPCPPIQPCTPHLKQDLFSRVRI